MTQKNTIVTKLFEMFAGYGGASFALKKLEIPFECVGYSEIDKYAIQCYEQNHKGKNFGDCSKIKIEDLPNFDLLTGGFPCQDVSIAGNRDLSKGRTNLYLEILRIAKSKKPKFMVLENVKGLLSMEINERKLVNIIVSDLQKIGYGVCWKVLNSKDYGTPQNRERVWFVCKLGGWDFMEFMFPEKEKLKIFLKDILDKEVDKKYYLSQKQVENIIRRNKNFNMKGNRIIEDTKECFSGLTCNQNHNDILCIGGTQEHQTPRSDGISPSLNSAMGTGGGQIPIITHSLFPRSGNPKQGGTGHLSKEDGTSYCLDTGNCQAVQIVDLYNHKIKEDGVCITLTEPHHNNLRIIDKGIWRKLTPNECFRLMGFFNNEINVDGLSDTQCYRLTGNGWDINVASKIFKRLKGALNDTKEISCAKS